jgi:hypothetical protein
MLDTLLLRGEEYGLTQVACKEDSNNDAKLRNRSFILLTLGERKSHCETHCCLLKHRTVNSYIL